MIVVVDDPQENLILEQNFGFASHLYLSKPPHLSFWNICRDLNFV